MEYEVRFYFPKTKLEELVSILESENDLTKSLRTYEKTTQYNHSDINHDFYSKEVDGRFRIRVSTNDEKQACKLTWKRRLPETIEGDINKEEEKEVSIDISELDDFVFIVENVMHFTIVESYERYRTTFSDNDIEICIDEYPFGIALEIESQKDVSDPEKIIKEWIEKLGFNLSDSYRLSWDDKYEELCKEQNKPIYKVVTFEKEMPIIKEKE